jgi:hypothetical protein
MIEQLAAELAPREIAAAARRTSSWCSRKLKGQNPC